MKTKEEIIDEICPSWATSSRELMKQAMEAYASQLQDMSGGKRELGEITDEHAIEVAKILYPSEDNWSSKMQTVDNGKRFTRSLKSIEDIGLYSVKYPLQKVINAIDYLRHFYNIPNAYAPSNQQLLAEVERLKGENIRLEALNGELNRANEGLGREQRELQASIRQDIFTIQDLNITIMTLEPYKVALIDLVKEIETRESPMLLNPAYLTAKQVTG